MKKLTSNMPKKEVDAAIFISPNLPYIYVNVPKTACSTIKLTLWLAELSFASGDSFVPKIGAEIHDRHLSPFFSPSDLSDDELVRKWSDDFIFCFVRNPYTRLLSCYLDKIVRGYPPKGKILSHLGKDPNDLKVEISFEAFVRGVVSQNSYEMDEHWRIQSDQSFQNWIQYSFIGRFEHFQEDFDFALKSIFPGELSRQYSHSQHATSAGELVEAYYTEELAKLVFDKYRSDFEAFGYPSELP